MQYEGISSEILFLLAENRFQDSKSFYEEHKAAIKAGAIDPLRRLVADVAPAGDPRARPPRTGGARDRSEWVHPDCADPALDPGRSDRLAHCLGHGGVSAPPA